MLKTFLLLTAWLFCFSTTSNGQANLPNFKFTGVLKGLGDKKILLGNKGRGYGSGFEINYFDSVVSKRDTFYFEGYVSEPQFYSIEMAGQASWVSFVVENSQISVRGSADSIWKSKISGSSEHAAYSKFNDSLYFPTVRALSVIRQKRDAARAKGRIDEAERLADSLGIENKRLVEKTLQFIKTYPNKFVSLDKLYDLLPVIPVDTAKLYFESLSEHLRAHSLAKKLNTRLFAFSENPAIEELLKYFEELKSS